MTVMATDYRKQLDLDTWKEYRKNPTPKNREDLLKRFDGIINTQVNRWAGPIPKDVLRNKAKALAAKSFDTYDPTKGAALSTHITNSLQPLSRTVYTYQNAARIPENLVTKINKYNNDTAEFRAMNGRDPLPEEIGWKSGEAQKLQKYIVKDLVESGKETGMGFRNEALDARDENTLDGIYDMLSDTDKQVFEHATGYNGAPTLSVTDSGKALGLTNAQINWRRKVIREQIANFMNRPSVRRNYGG